VVTVTLRKDLAATGLTAAVVAVFLAAHESWGVPLVGGSVRWAALAVLLLGVATCALGTQRTGPGTVASAALGALAFALGLLAILTGSLTLLSLLVLDVVVLWATSTARHVRAAEHRPVHP